jgi:tetratricopeptide (TPR) repeat protein
VARKTNSKTTSSGKTTRKVRGAAGKSVSISAPELAISRIEEIYSRDRHSEALVMLLPLERQYPFSDPMLSGRFDRLLAFVYTHLKKFSEAEQIIRRGQELHPGALDFLFASCYIKLSLREFGKALEEGKMFLQLAATLDPRSCSPLDTTIDQLASVLNYVGTAMLELGNREGAKRAFEEAIAKDCGNYLPYLNLIGLYAHERNWDQVNSLVDQGLKQCRNITELRMLAETYKKRATVSACIMVKNEEEMLPGCLDSLRDWVDEIVIVDTGSTDRTVEIAHQYGAKVFHHPWQNSFSESRNHTLEHATSDWVFIIDADERLYIEDIPQVYQILNQTEYPLVAVNVFNFYPEIEDTVTFLPSKRFFRTSLGLRYSGIVHNQLQVPEGTLTLKTAIRIKHYGYGLSKERMTAKLARTRALLEKQLSESPDDAFALFNYAQLHRASPDGFKPENAEKVLKAAGRAIQITNPDNPVNRHLFYMCLDQLGWTHY